MPRKGDKKKPGGKKKGALKKRLASPLGGKRSGDDRVGQLQGSSREGGAAEEGDDHRVYEDPFEDEFGQEEVLEDVGEEGYGGEGGEDGEDGMDTEQGAKELWRAGDGMEEGEELQFDPSAYVMYHPLRAEWPALSFDIIRDDLGGNRTRFPLTMYAVAGSQADRAESNKLTIMKFSDLHRLPRSRDEEVRRRRAGGVRFCCCVVAVGVCGWRRAATAAATATWCHPCPYGLPAAHPRTHPPHRGARPSTQMMKHYSTEPILRWVDRDQDRGSHMRQSKGGERQWMGRRRKGWR